MEARASHLPEECADPSVLRCADLELVHQGGLLRRFAGGQKTIAQVLEQLVQAAMVHPDDRLELRTLERLSAVLRGRR